MSKVEEEELRKIRFGPEEVGWAAKVGDDLYRIRNVPMSDGLNFNDLVRWDGIWQSLPEVIEEGLAHRLAVWYSTESQYHEIKDKLKASFEWFDDFIVEGWLGPKEDVGKRGLLIVSYSKKEVYEFLLAASEIKEPDEEGDAPELIFNGFLQ